MYSRYLKNTTIIDFSSYSVRKMRYDYPHGHFRHFTIQLRESTQNNLDCQKYSLFRQSILQTDAEPCFSEKGDPGKRKQTGPRPFHHSQSLTSQCVSTKQCLRDSWMERAESFQCVLYFYSEQSATHEKQKATLTSASASAFTIDVQITLYHCSNPNSRII